MSDAIAALSLLNDAIFVSLINTTLRITLLISLIALIIRVFRIKSAPTRYSLWLLALLAVLILPIFTPFIPQVDFTRLYQQRLADYRLNDRTGLGMESIDAGDMSMAGGSVPSASAEETILGEKTNVSLINPVSIAYFIWFAGALSMLFRTIVVYGKLRKLRLCSSDIESKAVLDVLSRLREKLGIRRTVTLKSSPRVYAPVGLGVFYPTIILPDDVMDDEPVEELEMILAHELAHIKRLDYLVRFLQNVLKVLFFFHPLFHLLKRNLAREREHICDDWVIHVTEHRSKYAECLVDMLERVVSNSVNIPVTIAMAERKQDIPGRIDMIVDKKRKLNTKVSMKALIVVSLIGFLALFVIGGTQLVRFAEAAEDEGNIVFTSDRGGGWDLYVMDADGANMRRLTYGADGWEPCWSPDGKNIAFTSSLQGEPPYEIYVVDSDGANVKRLTNTIDVSKIGWGSSSPSWSPDGNRIVFCSTRTSPTRIFMMDADGTNPEVLIDVPDGWHFLRSSWSSDGKIAFSNNPGGDDYGIWAIGADGSNRRLLIDMPGHDVQSSWHPDGKSLVFTNLGSIWQGEVTGGENLQIYIVDADGQNARKLVDGWCPSWSPDGRRIVFCSQRDGDWGEIYAIDADGKNLERLTNNPAFDSYPHWWGAPLAVEPAGKLQSTWGKIKTLMHSR